MKNPKSRTPTLRATRLPGLAADAGTRANTSTGAAAQHRVFRTQVAVGDVISFDPTGERLRVTQINGEEITFEKLP